MAPGFAVARGCEGGLGRLEQKPNGYVEYLAMELKGFSQVSGGCMIGTDFCPALVQ